MIIINILLLCYFINIALADQLYPVILTSEIQFENDGWIDCNTQIDILPTNCAGNDLLWIECYEIPKNGLCSKQNILISNSIQYTYTFSFYIETNSSNQITVQINEQSSQLSIINQNNISRGIIQTSVSSGQVTIKIIGEGQQFTGLTITQDCQPNCKTCSQLGFCDICSDDYFLYNYKCIQNECIDQISQITSSSFQAAQGSIENDNYFIQADFNFIMGECLIPKIYFAEQLQNSLVKLFINETQIQYGQNNTRLEITLPLSQIVDICEIITTSTAYIYQCYIGIAITTAQSTQQIIILIGQVSINIKTEIASVYTQSINIPSDLSKMVGPIFIVSQTLSVTTNSAQKQVKVLQTISDPNFSNYRISYYNASIEQNNQTISLTLNMYLQQGVNTTFIFDWNSSSFDPNENFTLNIISSATQSQSRRVLETSFNRTQLQVNYQVQNQYNFQNLGIFNNDSNSNNMLIIISISSFIGAIILILLLSYGLQKVNEEKYPCFKKFKSVLQNLE